jgi:tetratricopeptide (TPR) repeat protein
MRHMQDNARSRWLPVTSTSEPALAHFERGRAAAHHYQFEAARDHLDAALALDPTFVLALLHRGGSADDLDEARAYLDSAAANRMRASEDEGRMIDAFRAFLLDRDHHRAIEILLELSAAYPGDPYVPSYIGLRYYRNLQRYDEARDQFRQALERDPGFVQALNWLGHIALDQGDLATAEATFERYVALAPGEPRPHDSLGLLYLRQGRFEDAIRAFEAALAHDARFDESRSNLERARAARAQARAQGEARRVGADGDSDAPRDDQG